MKNWQKTLLASVIFALSTTSALVHANTPKQQFQQAVTFIEKGNYQAAFPIFKQLAEQGGAAAQFNLGLMYEKGRGVKQDYQQAAKWYQQAAEQGVTEAQFNLGVMYLLGQGVKQNNAMAKMWLGKACDNGHQKGCYVYRMVNEGKLR